ncbi:MAG: hypothetical protein ACLSH1_05885 [Clostridia bacterium]
MKIFTPWGWRSAEKCPPNDCLLVYLNIFNAAWELTPPWTALTPTVRLALACGRHPGTGSESWR